MDYAAVLSLNELSSCRLKRSLSQVNSLLWLGILGSTFTGLEEKVSRIDTEQVSERLRKLVVHCLFPLAEVEKN